MGIFNTISNAIDTVITTVKEAVAPKNAQKVSKKETIQMVSEKTQAQQTNEDKVEIKRKTKHNAYKFIEELCVKNNININEAKKANLLEKVTGFSSEELATKNEKELQPFINALKTALSNRKWAFWKSNSGEENLDKIAKSANDKYIDSVTGRGFWGNLFRSNANLAKKLEKAGYNEINETNVKAYFKNLMAEAIASGDKEKIRDAYTEAFKTFGDLLKDTDSSEHKALLTAAISELQANVRTKAARLSITSCMNNQTAKQKVARGIGDNLEAISGKDALGERISQNENIEIAQLSFQNMTEEDSLIVLTNMAARRRELAKKAQSGETLTEDERHYLNEAQSYHYSGALVGTSCNSNIQNPSNVMSKIDKDTEEFGIREKVYSAAAEYVQSNQDKLPITPQEFTQKVDRATNGNYSKVLENAKNESKESAETKTQQNNSETKTTAKENKKTNTNITADSKTANFSTSKKTNKTNKEYSKTVSITSKTTQKETKTESQIQATQVKKENTPKPKTSQEAIQSGVKAIKEYAKENKVNTLELAIDSLNSNNLSSSTKQWALKEFERAESSLQKLNFAKITKGSNAIAAAKVMDEKTRSELTTFRCFEIKEAVENIDKKQTA